MTILDALNATLIHILSVSDGIWVWDAATANRIETVNESLAGADAVQIQLNIRVLEYIWLQETLLDNWFGSVTVNESLIAADAVTLIKLVRETVDETFALTDSAPSIQVGIMVAEYLNLKETLTATAVFNKEINEQMALTDAAIYNHILSLAESMALADAASIVKVINELLNESMSLADVLSTLCSFNKTVTDTAGLTDAANFGRALTISEALAAADTITNVYRVVATLSESLAAVDTVTGTLGLVFALSESLVMVDALTSNGHFTHTVTEGLRLNVTITLDDEVYECFVLNTPKFYPSAYSGFNFNSYCTYQNRAFGANDTGIFELTGTTDNGTAIHAGALLHSTDFGMRNKKRFRKAYLGISGTAPVMVMEQEGGERKVYTIDDKGMVDASREIDGREWVLSVSDFDDLDSIKLIPVILARGV
jgi:hypothetical protein